MNLFLFTHRAKDLYEGVFLHKYFFKLIPDRGVNFFFK